MCTGNNLWEDYYFYEKHKIVYHLWYVGDSDGFYALMSVWWVINNMISQDIVPKWNIKYECVTLPYADAALTREYVFS